jgi:hypothetical protein
MQTNNSNKHKSSDSSNNKSFNNKKAKASKSIGNSFFTDAILHILINNVINNDFKTDKLHQVIGDESFSDEAKEIIKLEAEKRLQENRDEICELKSMLKYPINNSELHANQFVTFIKSLNKLNPATSAGLLYGTSRTAHYEISDDELQRQEEEHAWKLKAIRYEKRRRELSPLQLIYQFLINRYFVSSTIDQDIDEF